MSKLKSLASQTVIYGLSTILGRTIGFVLYPILTWVVSKEQFGTIGELYSYMAFLNILAAMGMETAYFHFANKNNEEKAYSQGLFVVSGIASVLALSIFVLAPYLNQILLTHNANYYRVGAAILLFDALAILPFARLRFQNKAKKFALLKLGNIFTNVGFNLFFLFALPWLLVNGFDFLQIIASEDKVLYFFIANLLASLLVLLLLSPNMRLAKWQLDTDMLKQMLRYSWPLLIVGLSAMINETLDKPMLRWLLPLDEVAAREQVGIYTSVYKLSIIMAVVVQAFKFAAEPFFFSIQKDKDAKASYALILKWFVIFQCLIFIGVSINLDVLLLIIDPSYRVGKAVVPLVLLAQMCLGIYYNLSIWYKLTEKTIWGSYISLFGAIITIVANIALVPIMGYFGAAWATLLCYSSMMMVSIIIGNRFYPVKYQWIRIFSYMILAIVLWYLTSNFLPQDNMYLQFLYSIIALGILLALVWLVEKPKNLILLRK